MQVLRTFSCACPWASSGRLCRLPLFARGWSVATAHASVLFLMASSLNISCRTLFLPTVALPASFARRPHLSERRDLVCFCNSRRISHPSTPDLNRQERFSGITMPCAACNQSRKIVLCRKIHEGAAFG